MTFLVSVRVPRVPVPFGRQREVDVGAQVALVHPRLGDAEGDDQLAELRDVRLATSGAFSPAPMIGRVTISMSGMPARL